jgi:MerR family transcriptional regulator, copper efflux regulator
VKIGELADCAGVGVETMRRRAEDKAAAVEEKIAHLQRTRAALRQLIGCCSTQGRPEECALMHALCGDQEF